jgi:hypothetical protein
LRSAQDQLTAAPSERALQRLQRLEPGVVDVMTWCISRDHDPRRRLHRVEQRFELADRAEEQRSEYLECGDRRRRIVERNRLDARQFRPPGS